MKVGKLSNYRHYYSFPGPSCRSFDGQSRLSDMFADADYTTKRMHILSNYPQLSIYVYNLNQLSIAVELLSADMWRSHHITSSMKASHAMHTHDIREKWFRYYQFMCCSWIMKMSDLFSMLKFSTRRLGLSLSCVRCNLFHSSKVSIGQNSNNSLLMISNRL